MAEVHASQVLNGVKLTEKTAFMAEAKNVYTFEVPLTATKADVKKAVEESFGVRVEKVNTQMRVGQRRRFKAKYGFTKDKKRALVKLHSDDRIALY
jgi:large subunit ribosomal protein L23